eukprot:COSAG01_NODE_38902_length_483_cov_11.062500_1_plen_71_part_00
MYESHAYEYEYLSLRLYEHAYEYSYAPSAGVRVHMAYTRTMSIRTLSRTGPMYCAIQARTRTYTVPRYYL